MILYGSSACSGVSTLGAGPSPTIQLVMNRIVSAQRRQPAEGEPSQTVGPMVRRSVPLPFTREGVAILDRGVPPDRLDQRVFSARGPRLQPAPPHLLLATSGTFRS
jgi:hypothetical protein